MAVLNFTLSEDAVAAFRDVLACLNKFSDEVSLEAKKDKVSHLLSRHCKRRTPILTELYVVGPHSTQCVQVGILLLHIHHQSLLLPLPVRGKCAVSGQVLLHAVYQGMILTEIPTWILPEPHCSAVTRLHLPKPCRWRSSA